MNQGKVCHVRNNSDPSASRRIVWMQWFKVGMALCLALFLTTWPAPSASAMDYGVGKLTGEGSPSYEENSHVRGTDLGSMFEFEGKLHFLFGDVNLVEGHPHRHLSNVLAWTTDGRASNGLNLHYVTIRDIHPDFAHFYAKESRKQALASGCACTSFGCCPIDDGIFTHKGAHGAWAASQSDDAMVDELLRKTDAILETLGEGPAAAAYYADLAARLAALAIPFHDRLNPDGDSANFPRNAPFYDWHLSWAEGQSIATMRAEIAQRYLLIQEAIAIDLPKQVFPSKIFEGEYTAIPTHGVVVDGTIYVFFMSIDSWEVYDATGDPIPGEWRVNYASVATSTDGITFQRHDDIIRFGADSNFVQVAPVLQDEHLFLFGIPAGRHGALQLARVARDRILDPTAYQLLARRPTTPAFGLGSSASVGSIGGPAGATKPSLTPTGAIWRGVAPTGITVLNTLPSHIKAHRVVPAPVAEPSIAWHPHHERWLLSYLKSKVRRIVLRESDDLMSWGSPQRVVPCRVSGPHGLCYGGYLHSSLMKARSIYMVLSSWSFADTDMEERYNTFLIKHAYP